MPIFYITGLFHTETLNDSTLPPIEVEALDELDALMSIGATVWTKEAFEDMRSRSIERGLVWPDPIKRR